MDKLVTLHEGSRLRFVTEPIVVDWLKLQKRTEQKRLIVICLKDMESDCIVIHPISSFVWKWQNNQFNTMRKHAVTCAAFLNFVQDNQRDLKIDSFADLTLSVANEYLNSMVSNSRAYGTVKDAEYTLTQLYLHLHNVGVLKKVASEVFIKETGTYRSYYKSPFSPTYPSRNPKTREHLLPFQYIGAFLESVILVANPILLGTYFQLFGGLRYSEVVNIKRSDVRVKQTGDLIIKLVNNNLRTDIKSGNAGVKRPREQRILAIFDWLDVFKDNHYKLYKQSDGSNALFVNRDGRAMSAGSYRQYFEQAKNHFIKRLKASADRNDNLLGNHLNAADWSTHIGRGTFTNLLAEVADNLYDIAQPRGDKQLYSALTYMSNTERMKKKMEAMLHQSHTQFVPDLILQRQYR